MLITALTINDLLKENPGEKLKAINNLGIIGIITLILIYIINLLLEGSIIKTVFKSGDNKIAYLDAIGTYCTGSLFSNITPMKIGNMPSIIYYYSKIGMEVDKSIASYIETNFIYSFSMAIICLICTIFCYTNSLSMNIGTVNVQLGLVALVGLIYNIVMVAGCTIIAFNSFLQKHFVRICATILKKFKRIEDKEEYYRIQDEKLKLYREGIKNFLKDYKISLLVLFLYIIKIFLWGSVPYVIYLFVSKSNFDIQLLLYCFMLSQLLNYISNIVPIPGASGAIEFSFLAVYANIFEHGLLVSVVLIWRALTYFLPIVVGFFFFIRVLNRKQNLIEKKASE